MSEHYFSAEPTSTPTRRGFSFEFSGEQIPVQVDGGVFSATRLDPGTRVLLKYLEKHSSDLDDWNSGKVLDVGCGWGSVSLALAKKYPRLEVVAVDVNQRALENTQRNAELNRLANVHTFEPDSVPETFKFEEIWSNPPIRIGKVALQDLLVRWLSRLSVDGVATFVVAKQLGAPSLQVWLTSLPGYACIKLGQDKGYWVLRVRHEG